MEMKDQGLIPGFMGEAMRSANLENVQREGDLGQDANPLGHGKKQTDNMNAEQGALEAAIAENAAIQSGSGVVITNKDLETYKKENNMNKMENLNETFGVLKDATMETSTKSKVLSGKNGADLETSINNFLSENPNIDIIRTDFGTAVGGVYYTILYRTQLERV